MEILMFLLAGLPQILTLENWGTNLGNNMSINPLVFLLTCCQASISKVPSKSLFCIPRVDLGVLEVLISISKPLPNKIFGRLWRIFSNFAILEITSWRVGSFESKTLADCTHLLGMCLTSNE